VIRFSGAPGTSLRAGLFVALALGAVLTAVAATLMAVRTPDERSDHEEFGFGTSIATAEATSPAAATPSARARLGASPTTAPTGRQPGSPAAGWPRPGDGVTGLPAGWKPKRTVHGSLVVRTARTVVEDVEVIGGDIEIHAPNVTVRRVRVSGGGIGNWWGDGCDGTLTIDRSEIHGAGQTLSLEGGPVIGPGSYVARNVLIDGVVEGFRIGEATADYGNRCGPAVIKDSFVRIAEPVECRGDGPYPDWHGDGLQGFKGAGVTVTHTTIQMLGNPAKVPCDGTSPFFWPADSNGPARVNGLLVIGGAAFAFRLWTAGEVRGLLVASGYGGVEVGHCALLSAWEANYTAVDLRTFAVGPIGAKIPCVSAG
jgi:hypothetical protein